MVTRRELLDVKNRIRDRYLGHGGIHGIGSSYENLRIKFYVDQLVSFYEEEIMDNLRRDAMPMGVEVINEPFASMRQFRDLEKQLVLPECPKGRAIQIAGTVFHLTSMLWIIIIEPRLAAAVGGCFPLFQMILARYRMKKDWPEV